MSYAQYFISNSPRLLSALTGRYSGDGRMRRIAPIRPLPGRTPTDSVGWRADHPWLPVDDALSADSGPLSIDSISPPSDPSRKSCLLASGRCPYLDIDLRTEAALHSEEATDGARWTILSCCCCPTRSLPRLSKSSRRHLKRFKRAVASFASSGKG